MKNINFLLGLILLGAFSACNEIDDVYDELDAEQGGLVRIEEYTLTEDDYDLVEKSFGNFNNDDEAKELVPTVLNDVFPYLGVGSTVFATYDIYNGSSPYYSNQLADVTVSDAEYDALGYGFGNFDDKDADLPNYASFKFPDASTGDYVDVTHDYYNGGFTESDVVTRVVYTAPYGWVKVTELDSDLYQDFFNEVFSNFSSSDEAEEKIPAYLNTLSFSESGDTFEEGDALLIQYIYYDGGVIEDIAHFTFDGSDWLLYGDAYQVTSSTLQFAREETTWVPDNTIAYTLGFEDWQSIGNAWLDRNQAGAESALQYGNFDITLWSDSQRFEAITERLAIVYPNPEDGQKYKVTYATWEPGNGTRTLDLIYQGGEYVENTPD